MNMERKNWRLRNFKYYYEL